MTKKIVVKGAQIICITYGNDTAQILHHIHTCGEAHLHV